MNVQLKSTELPPFRPLPMKAPAIDVSRKPDGSIYLSSRYPIAGLPRSIAHLFAERGRSPPERRFIGERTPLPDGTTGDWRFISYGEANAHTNAVAQALIDRGLGP